MKRTEWNIDNIKDLTEKVIIITGANTGLGYKQQKSLQEKTQQLLWLVVP